MAAADFNIHDLTNEAIGQGMEAFASRKIQKDTMNNYISKLSYGKYYLSLPLLR